MIKFALIAAFSFLLDVTGLGMPQHFGSEGICPPLVWLEAECHSLNPKVIRVYGKPITQANKQDYILNVRAFEIFIFLSISTETLSKILDKIYGFSGKDNSLDVSASLCSAFGGILFAGVSKFEHPPAFDRQPINADVIGGRFPFVSEVVIPIERQRVAVVEGVTKQFPFKSDPRSLLASHDLVGVLSGDNSVTSLPKPIFTLPYCSDQKNDADGTKCRAKDGNQKQQHSPKSHILLRLQVFIGGLIAIMGFKIISNTLPEFERGNIMAGFGYFVSGLVTIILGVLLISGIGLMYSLPML